VLSILRPAYARVLEAAVLATLFVPTVVLLVPLFITVARPAFGPSLLNTFLGVWLPTAANAFNIIVVKRFFDSLPREVFEAARSDGAGPVRMFVSLVLPMSKPIVGVVSVFIIIASLKDYLWPKLVLPDPAVQPLGVRLPNIQSQTELDVTLAALAISTIIPVVMFLLFQRVFLRGAGLGGAVKGQRPTSLGACVHGRRAGRRRPPRPRCSPGARRPRRPCRPHPRIRGSPPPRPHRSTRMPPTSRRAWPTCRRSSGPRASS
jgi:multiple sugar transport system permease protein